MFCCHFFSWSEVIKRANIIVQLLTMDFFSLNHEFFVDIIFSYFRCWHSSPWSTHTWHGHLWHVFSCGVPTPMGRPWSDSDHDFITANLWNIDHDFKNCAHIHGETYVFWQKTGNATLFRIYWVPLSCLQKPSWLLS